MNEIYCVCKMRRTRRIVRATGKQAYMPAIAASIEIDDEFYPTGLEFCPANAYGWHRFRYLARLGMAKELGKIGSTTEYLFLVAIDESVANVWKHLEEDVELWTLREFLSGFTSFSPAVQGAWPPGWFELDDNDEPDPGSPVVGIAPSWAEDLLDEGEEAPVEEEWQTASTLAQAEELVRNPS